MRKQDFFGIENYSLEINHPIREVRASAISCRVMIEWKGGNILGFYPGKKEVDIIPLYSCCISSTDLLCCQIADWLSLKHSTVGITPVHSGFDVYNPNGMYGDFKIHNIGELKKKLNLKD